MIVRVSSLRDWIPKGWSFHSESLRKWRLSATKARERIAEICLVWSNVVNREGISQNGFETRKGVWLKARRLASWYQVRQTRRGRRFWLDL